MGKMTFQLAAIVCRKKQKEMTAAFRNKREDGQDEEEGEEEEEEPFQRQMSCSIKRKIIPFQFSAFTVSTYRLTFFSVKATRRERETESKFHRNK